MIYYTSRAIFNIIPLSGTSKENVIQFVSSRFAWILNVNSVTNFQDESDYKDYINNLLKRESLNEVNHYVTKITNKPLTQVPVKILAFYLPQFHTIPENDTWWGKGFTEWTNVKPALAKFEGHYQPHIPIDLGYYDLLDKETLQKQVEIAKNYGIGGFCFHFYWFNKNTLLEKPIENYLLNPQLDLPFCLSWANENWTRRWDGKESDILIQQQHSPEDDLAFIQHVSKYMRDSRYIRIDNKPLLLVYRPFLLPSPENTAERWRNWCRTNDIGEIYLANVQSFDKTIPLKIGYDAAVEFPPFNFNPLNITHLIKPQINDFKGMIYDWNTLKLRSDHYAMPAYKLFRGVCPAWDNTPRRKNNSTIYINNQPGDFQQWVNNAIRDTIQRFDNPDERLIFVNAWNEWAEGAHLEPDDRYGYAYLQSIYDALHKFSFHE